MSLSRAPVTKLSPVALPNMSHLGSKEFERVYEPSDDTFLLVDALSADAAEMRRRRPSLCVEVGSGSGAVLTHLGSVLQHAALVAGDVNLAACTATLATSRASCVGTAPSCNESSASPRAVESAA